MCFKRRVVAGRTPSESRIDCIFKWTGRLLGAFLVTFAVVLISGGTYTYLKLVLPYVLGPNVDPMVYRCHRITAAFFAVQAVFNYVCAVITDPGSPEVPPGLKYVPSRGRWPDYSDDEFDDGTLWKHCSKCDSVKPPRTHHCNICRRCVLNMDHHCPWVNNCVGYRNYRFFYLFLLYTHLGTLYGAVTMFGAFERMDPRIRSNPPLVFAPRPALCMLFPLATAVCAAVGLLLLFHTYLLFSAQTTIELYKNMERASEVEAFAEKFVHPFSSRSKRGNFEQVFGAERPWLLALVLPSLRPPPVPRIPIDIVDAPEEFAKLAPIHGSGGSSSAVSQARRGDQRRSTTYSVTGFVV